MSSEHKSVRQLALRSLIASGVIGLTACDGSVIGNPDNSNPSAGGVIAGDGPSGTTDGNGILFSHRAAGATVCFDLNHNTRCDALEPTGIAAEDGSFSLQPVATPMPLVAELPATVDSPAVSLYAAAGSSTISALTTIYHWYRIAHPTLSAEQVSTQLQELLALSSLDTAPLSQQPRSALDDAGLGAVNTDSIELDQAQQAAQHLARVRQTLEAFIARIETSATEDALAAGIDPGLEDTQQRLSHLVAAHSLLQLSDLVVALNASDETSPEAIAAALPAPSWPADDIHLALQGVVLESPAESDPIALLSDTLAALQLNCEDTVNCDLMLSTHSSADGENLQVTQSIVYAADRVENQPALVNDISNFILSGDGVWQAKDSSGSGTLSRSAEYKATLLDNNNIAFELSATTRDIGGTPLVTYAPYTELTQSTFLVDSGTFAEGAQAITLQRVQLSKSYELTLNPSDEMRLHVAALQAVQQAQLTLDRLQHSLDTASDELQANEQFSAYSNAEAERTQTAVDALIQAKTNAEQSLASAQTAQQEAQSTLDDVATNQALISAYESVLSDAQDTLAVKTTAATEANSASAAATQLQSTAQTALDSAETAVADAIAAAELASVPDPSTDADVIAAQAALQQAQADEIVASAGLAQATALATTAIAEANAAEQAAQSATETLAQARADQVSDTDAQTALQQAELAIVASQANLELVEQQFDTATLDATLAETQAVGDLAALSSAQADFDAISVALATASTELSTRQAAVESNSSTAISNGCAEQLPLQASDNYNCTAVERRIGSSPTSVVQNLQEITGTFSTLTLLNLYPDYAVTLKPSTGAAAADAIWHSSSSVFDPLATEPVQSRWSQQSINGVTLLTVEIPTDLRQPGGATAVLLAEHDNYVRPGLIAEAGAVETMMLLNQQALDSILAAGL